jgi:uncharacterized 2Fe-2S/4Fe-4S cluster protein (DUF4445 family)
LFTLDFEPVGHCGQFTSNQSILECARQLGVEIVSICGGIGSCHHCKVKIISGQISKITREEENALAAGELAQGYRLACMAYPLSDTRLYVPTESLSTPQRTQVEGLEVDVAPDPVIRWLEVRLTPPSLEAPQSDDQNLLAAMSAHDIAARRIDLQVQQSLSPRLRKNHWQVSVALRGDEIIAIGPPATRWLGLAIDIGTTKIAGYLLDLATGRTLVAKGIMNPQITYGEDVITRIAVASKLPENAAQLQSLLTEALNQLVGDLCTEANTSPDQIADAVVVGNTAMHHLFLKLPVKQLGLSPYVPAIQAAVDIKARDLDLRMAPGASVHLLPNIAGYVGADHVAMLLAVRMAEAEGVTLAIDIGTNTEICISHNGKMSSVSCASGPAFEGAHIQFGMRATPGAIEHARLENGRLEIQTISGEAPIGICGSGLLDVVAQLRIHNMLDRSGKMGPHPLVRCRGSQPEFVLTERPGLEDITVSQKDIRELQLAKAAIRVGIQALLEAEGLAESDIQQVFIAGAFGTFIDVQSAITIGMLPRLPLERFRQVGNAAGTGARLALMSRLERAKAWEISRNVGYIELANLAGFQRKFATSTYLD